MTPQEIEAADHIMKVATVRGITVNSFLPLDKNGQKSSPPILGKTSNDQLLIALLASQYLIAEGLLVAEAYSDTSHLYKLTKKGLELQESGLDFSSYLNAEKEKKRKQNEKDELDFRHKILQIEDLETKLKIINKEQLDFWKSQKEKNVQTTLIAIISALFALVAMLKSFGYF